jgi:hypothetical protein
MDDDDPKKTGGDVSSEWQNGSVVTYGEEKKVRRGVGSGEEDGVGFLLAVGTTATRWVRLEDSAMSLALASGVLRGKERKRSSSRPRRAHGGATLGESMAQRKLRDGGSGESGGVDGFG